MPEDGETENEIQLWPMAVIGVVLPVVALKLYAMAIPYMLAWGFPRAFVTGDACPQMEGTCGVLPVGVPLAVTVVVVIYVTLLRIAKNAGY